MRSTAGREKESKHEVHSSSSQTTRGEGGVAELRKERIVSVAAPQLPDLIGRAITMI